MHNQDRNPPGSPFRKGGLRGISSALSWLKDIWHSQMSCVSNIRPLMGLNPAPTQRLSVSPVRAGVTCPAIALAKVDARPS